MHPSEKFEFDPSAFLDRSRRFLEGKKFPVGLLREALKDEHVRNVIARMEQVRQGEPTVTSITKKAGSTRFRVHELSPESPGTGGGPDPYAYDYLAKLMQGRGAALENVLSTTGYESASVISSLDERVDLDTFKPRPMTLHEYRELTERGVKMDLTTRSYLLPPWDEVFRRGSPWLSDGVYFGDNGQVVHITANGERTIWQPTDEICRKFAAHNDPTATMAWTKGSPDRGVRYAFEFFVRRLAKARPQILPPFYPNRSGL